MKSRSNRGKWAVAFVVAVIVLAALAGGVLLYVFSRHDGDAKWFYLPTTTTPASLKDSLVDALGPSQGAKVYNVWRTVNRRDVPPHGAYRVEPGEKALTTARRIIAGDETPVRVTFNNVRTLPELMQKLAARLECDSESLMDATAAVLPDHGFSSPAQYPAAFLPDTYEFYWSASPQKVVSTLQRYRNNFWNDTRRGKAAALGLTPVEVATLASIVEEESNLGEEQPLIARLYLNRLAKGMPLQADPTVKFAVGDFTLRRITGDHLRTPSPYNTYLHAGLPPGPIRVASPSAIDRVLNAPANNYLYMCAKEDFSGRHNFTSDYSVHQSNARRYHNALNKRNIR